MFVQVKSRFLRRLRPNPWECHIVTLSIRWQAENCLKAGLRSRAIPWTAIAMTNEVAPPLQGGRSLLERLPRIALRSIRGYSRLLPTGEKPFPTG